jgi:hypothetical protein
MKFTAEIRDDLHSTCHIASLPPCLQIINEEPRLSSNSSRSQKDTGSLHNTIRLLLSCDRDILNLLSP